MIDTAVDDLIIVLAAIGLISVLAAGYYYSMRWQTINEMNKKKEIVFAEMQNIEFHANSYRRTVQRARESLSLALMALNKTERNSAGLDIQGQSLIISSSDYNFNHVLEKINQDVRQAEIELMKSIKAANLKLYEYNVFVQSPMLPKIISNQYGMMPMSYDRTMLVEIDKMLNRGLGEISLLDNRIAGLLIGEGSETTPSDTGLDIYGEDYFTNSR